MRWFQIIPSGIAPAVLDPVAPFVTIQVTPAPVAGTGKEILEITLALRLLAILDVWISLGALGAWGS